MKQNRLMHFQRQHVVDALREALAQGAWIDKGDGTGRWAPGWSKSRVAQMAQPLITDREVTESHVDTVCRDAPFNMKLKLARKPAPAPAAVGDELASLQSQLDRAHDRISELEVANRRAHERLDNSAKFLIKLEQKLERLDRRERDTPPGLFNGAHA